MAAFKVLTSHCYRLVQIKAIGVHHLDPSVHEVSYKFLISIIACIHFSYCTKLRIGAKD